MPVPYFTRLNMSQRKCEECRRFISSTGGKCAGCGQINPPEEKNKKNSKNDDYSSDLQTTPSISKLSMEERVIELSNKLDKILEFLDELCEKNKELTIKNEKLQEICDRQDEKLCKLENRCNPFERPTVHGKTKNKSSGPFFSFWEPSKNHLYFSLHLRI